MSKTEYFTSMLWSQQKEDIARNRNIVKEIIDVFILCGRQNIAIRGGYRRQKYTSPDIQNKIIEIMVKW